MKNIAKKAVKKSVELAKRTGRQVAIEIAEIPKQSTKELTGVTISDAKKESPIVEAMKQGEESTQDEAGIAKKRKEGIERVKELELEMARLSKKREEKKPHAEEVEETVGPGEPMALPSSPPSRGLGKPGGVKSPEIRKSKN